MKKKLVRNSRTVNRKKRIKRPEKEETPLWEQEDPTPPNDFHSYRTGYQYKKKFNSLSVTRGKDIDERFKLHAWDAVQDCSKEDCPVYKRCEKPKEGPCKVVSDYLQNIMGYVLNNFRPTADEQKLFQFGMHILPLYKMLARLKLAELGSIHIDMKINNEIRRTIAAIEKSWKECGLLVPEVPDPPPGNPKKADDTSWYNIMSKA